MKKKLVLALLMATLLAGGAFAQEWYNSYAPGIDGSAILANVGIGFGLSPAWFKTSLPPITASVEYAGLPIPLSVGGYFGFARYKFDLFWSDDDALVLTRIAFGARAAWHFNFISNLDTYAGLAIGWMVNTYSEDYSLGSSGDFLYGFYAGGRYFFTNNIGVYLEAGYSGLTLVSAGLSLKF